MTRKGVGRGVALYGLASFLAIGLAAGVLILVYGSPAERVAVMWSAMFALVVQLVAFAIARLLSDQGKGIAGWGLGAAICLVALVIFGFVSRAFGIPQSAALVSLATFFFLTELIEPPLLNV